MDGASKYAAAIMSRVEKKAADYSLKEDPTYEDALKVFNKLDFDDRANLVPRHPDFLREVPDDMLFDRQVAVDSDGNPVGFQEFYLRKDKRGRRLSPHNIVAVVPDARGNGLARLMTEATVRKARKEKIKRLVWEAFADNEPSIRAAMSAGFKDVTPKNAKGHRRLVYDVSEKKASADVLANKHANMLYHGSSHELELLDGAKTRHAPGFVFVSPSKHHASLFALNRRKVVDVLKKQIGDAVKIKGLSYGQWEDDPSDKALSVADVYIETDRPFKPFSGKQKGYVYSVDSEPYHDKIKKWEHDNGDRELLIEGKVKPNKREKVTIRYKVRPGIAPWIEKTSAVNAYDPPRPADQIRKICGRVIKLAE